MLLPIFWILAPGICSEYLDLKSLYSIFSNDNCTVYFIDRYPHVLADNNYPLSVLRYKDEAIVLGFCTDIVRWESTVTTVATKAWDISYLLFLVVGDILLLGR